MNPDSRYSRISASQSQTCHSGVFWHTSSTCFVRAIMALSRWSSVDLLLNVRHGMMGDWLKGGSKV